MLYIIMVNYQNGLIYQIRERGNPEGIFYVGSTCNERDRRCKHKNTSSNQNDKNYNLNIYKHIRSVGGWECCIMERLHYFPCNSKNELRQEEGRVQKEFIGKGHDLKIRCIAGRTRKQYEIDNKERIAANKRRNYKDNIEYFTKESAKYRKANRKLLAEKAKKYREKADKDELAAYNKQYREKNKEKLLANGRQYYEDHKEVVKSRQREYNKNNKEAIAARRVVKMVCECGSEFRKADRARHFKSKKHIDYINGNQ